MSLSIGSDSPEHADRSCASPAGLPAKRLRTVYTNDFKEMVVQVALQRPENARIKPTCREFPTVTPVQLRNWIRKSPSTPIDADDDLQWNLYISAIHGLLTLHYIRNSPTCVRYISEEI